MTTGQPVAAGWPFVVVESSHRLPPASQTLTLSATVHAMALLLSRTRKPLLGWWAAYQTGACRGNPAMRTNCCHMAARL